MKPMIRILSLSALVLVGLIAALYFALPSNRLNISFPTSAEPGIGTPSPMGSTHGVHIAPPVLSATAGVNQITVSWPAVTGASSYEIWARTADSDWSQIDGGSLSGASTSFTHNQLTAGAVYYYTGRTVPTSGHESTWAHQTSATVLAPSGVPALTAAPAIGKIELSWTAVTAADNYHLITWIDGQADWERIGDPITGTVTTYTHAELDIDTTYHYRVRAVIDGTEGDWSDSVSAAPTVPAAPTLTASASTGQVALSWTAVTGADSYRLVMWNDDLEDWDRIGEPITHTLTAYTHTGLEPGHSYYYSVNAVIDGIEGDWATTISAVPLAPAAPTLTAAAGIGQIALNWNAVTGAESYHLITWKEGQAEWERIGDPLSGTTTSYTHTGTTAGANYYYSISGVLNSVQGDWSNTISAVPATASLPGLVATASGNQVVLNWSSVTGAESYHLITWNEGQTDWERIGDPLSATTTSYTHAGRTAGTAYYYRVRAVVNGTNGDWSDPIEVTP